LVLQTILPSVTKQIGFTTSNHSLIQVSWLQQLLSTTAATENQTRPRNVG